jgi:hypothetical protein
MSIDGESEGSTARTVMSLPERKRVQDVVAVRAHDELRDRQPHPPRRPGGQHVAEIAGRHAEGDIAVRRAERQRGGDVVGDLQRDAAPS